MHILQKMFDWIFPPSKEALCVKNLDASHVKNLYQEQHIGETLALSSYHHQSMRALIHEAKFHDNKNAAKLLRVLLELYIERHGKSIDVIIPIPVSNRRLRERGHNQVISILSPATFSKPAMIETQVLRRTKHTKPQTELSKKNRIQNVQGAFAVTHPERIAGKRVLLVDDVVTTGATMGAAKAALLPCAPTSIICLSLTH